MDYATPEHFTILYNLFSFLTSIAATFFIFSLVKQPTSKSAEEDEVEEEVVEESEEEITVGSEEEAEDLSQEDIVVESTGDVVGSDEELE